MPLEQDISIYKFNMTILSGCRAVQVQLLHIFCYCHLCSENKDWRWFRLQYFPHIDVTFVSWLGITKEKRKKKTKEKTKEKSKKKQLAYFISWLILTFKFFPIRLRERCLPQSIKQQAPSLIVRWLLLCGCWHHLGYSFVHQSAVLLPCARHELV